jgi:hypothetical protein
VYAVNCIVRAVPTKITVSWCMTPCRLVYTYVTVGGWHPLHIQGTNVRTCNCGVRLIYFRVVKLTTVQRRNYRLNYSAAGSHDSSGMSTLFAVGVRWFVSEVATVLRLARDCLTFNFSVKSYINEIVLICAERVALLLGGTVQCVRRRSSGNQILSCHFLS